MNDTSTSEATAEVKVDPMDYLYAKKFNCPVCEVEFEDYMIRRSRLRTTHTDIDFRTHYKDIDPNLYEVAACMQCGYAAMNNYFNKILPKQQGWIKEKITPNHKPTKHAVPYAPKDAVQRYNMALSCATAIQAKSSMIALICMRMSWIYKDAEDAEGERKLLQIAYKGFSDAFSQESFPLGNMDENTTKYVMANLARRLGNFEDALRLISDVVTSRNTTYVLKEKAKDMRDLIRDGNSE